MEITSSTTPLTSNDIINIYFSKMPLKGNTYISNIFSDQSPLDFPNFLSKVSSATFNFYIRDNDVGTFVQAGNFYKKFIPLNNPDIDISLGSTYINGQQKLTFIFSDKIYQASLLLNCDNNDGMNGLQDTSINNILPLNISTCSNPLVISVDIPTSTIYAPNHGLSSGSRVRFDSTGNLPNSLRKNKNYYVSVVSNDTFKVSKNSSLSPLLDMVNTGTGIHSMTICTPSTAPVPTPVPDTAIKKYGTSSLLFNTNNSLIYPPDTIQLGSKSTIEFWIYPISTGDIVVGNFENNSTWSISLTEISPGTKTIKKLDSSITMQLNLVAPFIDYNYYYYDNYYTPVRPDPTVDISPNTWTHIAITSEYNPNYALYGSFYLTVYKNGKKITTIPHDGLPSTIGNQIGQNFNGYIDDFRVFNNVILYRKDFTPPTAPLSNTGTIIL